MTEGQARRVANDLELTGNADTTLRGKRVLVAEDNVILSMHLSMMLEEAGATVMGPYPFVDEALGALAQESPDLAVLDYELATGNSRPIAKRLTDLSVPFAFFTSHDACDLEPWSTDAPVVCKPNTDETLIVTMTGLLGHDA
ncbi:response regulator [Parvularcula dongshanensis]|uniref:Two-component SAPR family response regulator n=1 Tax=Parvularcula dongshanensis TaxID=1173995 RepID=A0A840I2R6_9PROT|nr:response regulator [Parvularcula dongshanensis]MBB4658478.1 two-component SAPR family response regulator [Parvularcula dongshanensis]